MEVKSDATNDVDPTKISPLFAALEELSCISYYHDK